MKKSSKKINGHVRISEGVRRKLCLEQLLKWGNKWKSPGKAMIIKSSDTGPGWGFHVLMKCNPKKILCFTFNTKKKYLVAFTGGCDVFGYDDPSHPLELWIYDESFLPDIQQDIVELERSIQKRIIIERHT